MAKSTALTAVLLIASSVSAGADYRLECPSHDDVQSDIKQILQSSGDDEYRTPDARSPKVFEKVAFKGNREWFYWRLRDRGSQEKK